MNRNEIIDFFFGSYDRKTRSLSSGSFLISVIFAFYNGYLGKHYSSLWYGSICIYYILLSVLRAVLITSDLRLIRNSMNQVHEKRKKVFVLTHVVLVLLNLSLIIPISLMVRMQKPVEMTLIPAIAMAAYTTYKIIIASVNMAKKKKTENLLVKELRTINFIDALLSITVLQNTLITVNTNGTDRKMMVLSAISSAVILILMITASILGFINEIKQKTDANQKGSGSAG